MLQLAGWAIFAWASDAAGVVFRGGAVPRPVGRPRDGRRRRRDGRARGHRPGRVRHVAGLGALLLCRGHGREAGDERLALGGIALAGVAALLAIGVDRRLDDGARSGHISVTAGRSRSPYGSGCSGGRTGSSRRATGSRGARRRGGADPDRPRPPRHARPQPVGDRAQERARRRVLPTTRIGRERRSRDVERVAREALASGPRDRERLPPADARDRARRRRGRRWRRRGSTASVEPAPMACRATWTRCSAWAVREGVTNVLRHSEAPRCARISVTGRRRMRPVGDRGRRRRARRPRCGRPGTASPACASARAGLGGSVEAGPLPDGGFRLRVSVPVARAAPAWRDPRAPRRGPGDGPRRARRAARAGGGHRGGRRGRARRRGRGRGARRRARTSRCSTSRCRGSTASAAAAQLRAALSRRAAS